MAPAKMASWLVSDTIFLQVYQDVTCGHVAGDTMGDQTTVSATNVLRLCKP